MVESEAGSRAHSALAGSSTVVQGGDRGRAAITSAIAPLRLYLKLPVIRLQVTVASPAIAPKVMDNASQSSLALSPVGIHAAAATAGARSDGVVGFDNSDRPALPVT